MLFTEENSLSYLRRTMSGGARRLPGGDKHRCQPAVGDGQATAEVLAAVRQAEWSKTDSDATARTTDPGVNCTQRYYVDLY